MDIVTLALAKKYSNLMMAGLSSVTVDGTTINMVLADGSTASITVPTAQPTEEDVLAAMDDYFKLHPEYISTALLGDLTFNKETKTIEYKKADLSMFAKSPDAAEVGQVLAVKEVNADGMPVKYEGVDIVGKDDLLFYEADEIREPIDVITSPITLENDGGWAEAVIDFKPEQNMFTHNAELYININNVEYVLPVCDDDAFGDWDLEKYPYTIEIYDYDDEYCFAINNDEDDGSFVVSYARIVFASPDILSNPKYKNVLSINPNTCSISIGKNIASGFSSFAEGFGTESEGNFAHSEGSETVASGYASHAEGVRTQATGTHSHAEGASTVASGYASHAEGDYTVASGYVSHAEGYKTTASGNNSHAEGNNTVASGNTSHASGYLSNASGQVSFACGEKTAASNDRTFAANYKTVANGNTSTAFGQSTKTTETAFMGFTCGNETVSNARNQFVIGQSNIIDESPIDSTHGTNARKNLVIVGNGSSDGSARSNAHTLDWSGNAWYAGNVYVGSTSGKNKDAGSKKLAKEDNLLFTESSTIREPIDIIKTSTSIPNNNGWAELVIDLTLTSNLFTPNSVLQINVSGIEYELPLCDIDTYGDWNEDLYPYAVNFYTKHETTYVGISNHEYDKNELVVSYAKVVFNKADINYNQKYNDIVSFNPNNLASSIGVNNSTSFSSFAHGFRTTASNFSSHSEGSNTTASGYSSHAEGESTRATSEYSHAEGYYSFASGSTSHAEGGNNNASGYCSHAEGLACTASADESHAEGFRTTSSAMASHSEGIGTIASGEAQFVCGIGNVSDKTSLIIVGNGTKDNRQQITKRSNAHTIDKQGNAWYAGKVESASGKLKLGNTEITESQLQALLALLS